MGHPADTNGDGLISPEERAAWLAANPGKSFASGWTSGGGGNGFKTPWGNTSKWSDPTKDKTADQKRADLNSQGKASGAFADQGEQGYGAMSAEAQAARDQLRRYAEGKDSLSAEQLRQGLQANQAAMRSQAASASPQNAAMAARTAIIQGNRAAAGMSGAAAMAGIAERQAAQQALANMIMQQRQQDAQVALQGRGNAISAYGGVTPQGSLADRWANPLASAFGTAARLG